MRFFFSIKYFFFSSFSESLKSSTGTRISYEKLLSFRDTPEKHVLFYFVCPSTFPFTIDNPPSTIPSTINPPIRKYFFFRVKNGKISPLNFNKTNVFRGKYKTERDSNRNPVGDHLTVFSPLQMSSLHSLVVKSFRGTSERKKNWGLRSFRHANLCSARQYKTPLLLTLCFYTIICTHKILFQIVLYKRLNTYFKRRERDMVWWREGLGFFFSKKLSIFSKIP